MTNSINNQSQNKSQIMLVLLASVALDFIGFGIVIPLLPFYAKSYGASPVEVGLLIGVFSLMGIFAPALWGGLSDRLGRRRALLLNVTGTGLSYLGLSLANSLWMLFAARILAGISSASLAIAQSYVSDLTAIDNRTRNLGYLEAAAGIGFILGPALGGLLIGVDPQQPNFRLPSFVAFAASVLTLIVGFVALPPATRRNPSTPSKKRRLQASMTEIGKIFQRPLMTPLMGVMFLSLFAGMGVQGIFALWCQAQFGFGPRQFGYLVVFYSLLAAFIQVGLTGRLAQWWGETKLLLVSVMALGLGLTLIPFSTNIALLLGALAFCVYGQATGNPASASLLSQLAGAKQQGQTLGLLQSVSGLASFTGAIGSGLLFAKVGVNAPYWASGILVFVATAFCWRQITRSRLSAIIDQRRQQKQIYLFHLLDYDNNGILEFTDFQQAAQQVAQLKQGEPETPEYQQLESTWIRVGKQLQTLIDCDGKGQIELEAWLDYLEKPPNLDFSEALMNLMDTDGDQQINLEDLKIFYQTYGLDTTEIQENFDTLDSHLEGYIYHERFQTLLNQFLDQSDIQTPGNWLFGVDLARKL